MAQPTANTSRATGFSSILSRTQGFLRRHLWIWPLLAAALLAFVGIWVRSSMEGAIRTQVADTLRTILTANTEALRAWSATVRSHAEFAAEDDRVSELVTALARRSAREGTSQAALLNAPELAKLRTHLKPTLARFEFNGFFVLDTNATVIATTQEQLLGLQGSPGSAELVHACLKGMSVVTRPIPSLGLLPDEHGHVRTGVPIMIAAAPVRSSDSNVVAVLGLGMEPDRNFTRILATARAGDSGETFAFNSNGVMLSESRFDDDLKRFSIIPDTSEARSILTLELRDPLVDLREGKTSPRRRAELPFIRPVVEIAAGREGGDAKGYRDYRGVRVVGAWTWLPEFDFGLVTQVDVAEAFVPMGIMRLGFIIVFSLLVMGAGIIFLLMRLANRLEESARTAALQAKQLGQYALEEKLGAGAFGAVFRGRHALMRRPVAVKLLDPAQANEGSIARFEREVQLTCQLTHPNTIALYDYGRTPEGQFYYAMEYLDGLSLDELVKKYGRQPEGRVIHLLRQICASLDEAHTQGLVHRDVKPHNIFLTRRGGISDFVKVLDFGLVKARNLAGQVELTGATATLGTPLYMSPEAVEHPDAVDARSDIYSLGAVGYYLVTGETVFFGATISEVMMQQVKTEPQKPSSRLPEPLSSDFEELLLCCLAKKPGDRPTSARELEEALARCAAAQRWTRGNADDWWNKRAAAQSDKTIIAAPKS
jgi:predicted Ser/Thr protein kinase